MIDVERLTKDFGTVVAVQDVSFHVAKGEVVGFLGPNGAGKSTTLRMIAGFLGATSGTVRVNGYDIAEQSLAARRSLGYMPEAAPLYPELRTREYLGFRAALKGVARRKRKPAVERALELASCADMAEVVIGNLSKGYRQRVALADALLNAPPLLILDEPTAGLDPNQILEVRSLIRELGKEHTILLSTHILSEVEAVCDRALVVARGTLVAQGTLEELRRLRRRSGLTLVVRGEREAAESLLGAVDGVSRVQISTSEEGLLEIGLELAEGLNAGEVCERALAALVAAGLGVRAAAEQSRSLEQVFADVTRSEGP